MVQYGRDIVIYRGESYYAGTCNVQEGVLHIVKIAGQTYANHEGFENRGSVSLKEVSVAELDAWYRDNMQASWRGQPFSIGTILDGKAYVDYLGPSAIWAEQNGLEGDQYNGYHGSLDVDELEDVQVERIDYLTRSKRKPPG